jgi:hypothetical protein
MRKILTSTHTHDTPVELSDAELDLVTGGENPNLLPNGTIEQSNGASGAPGGSFGAPGQTNNPNPGK